MLINRTLRNEITVVRVKRGPEIFGEHYLLVAKVGINVEKQENIQKGIQHIKSTKFIKVYKLSEAEIAKE